MEETIGERFMRETSYDTADHAPSDQQRGLPQPPLQTVWNPGVRTIGLPDPVSRSRIAGASAAMRRRR